MSVFFFKFNESPTAVNKEYLRRLTTRTPIPKSKTLYLSESCVLYPCKAVHELQPKCLLVNIHCSRAYSKHSIL